ncbi:alkaline phosphatase family protein [Stygiolobus caldivivus]|uniref:Nucleotide pyrophosphatase n=1 Tax=Stygiolobus caldivivus TaxID=2824673 RepID=A0A8D5U7T4_9CREN|nr:alkaline phosphatase family protein [Stygiolobus caldivivus]BCU70386.1 nucleotide pyrophosphatase [Stygiolobus caldivivus]
MKVLLIVIDGMAFHIVEKIRHKLPTVNGLIEKGFFGKLESVFPSLTPIALASLVTGNSPKLNGVTAPKVFMKNKPLSNELSAYTSEPLKTDPIWVYLGKNGYKVLVTSSPQALPDRWKVEGTTLLDPYKSKMKKCSDAKVLTEGENKVLGKIWLVEKTSANKFYVSYPSPSSEKTLEIENNQWSSPILVRGKCGKEEFNGVTLLHAREKDIYLAPIAFDNKKWGNDLNLLEKVWNDVSLVHGMMMDGDHISLHRDMINFEEYVETVKKTFNFFMNYTKYLLDNVKWDFALTYLPVVDNVQHLLYGIEDEKASEYVFQSYLMADEFIKMQLDYADLVIVVSDHGVEKIKKKVFVNKLLERINVLSINEKDEIDWSKTKAYYGGGGQIRINLKGREEKGVVSLKEFPKLVRYIVRNLENLTDGNDKVFTSIYASESPAPDREGDIKIGGIREFYGISSIVRKDMEVIETIIPYKNNSGEHGYFRKNDLYGVIIAKYRQSELKRPETIQQARIIDVAPTILKLFGINNIKMEGRPIIKLLEAYESSHRIF